MLVAMLVPVVVFQKLEIVSVGVIALGKGQDGRKLVGLRQEFSGFEKVPLLRFETKLLARTFRSNGLYCHDRIGRWHLAMMKRVGEMHPKAGRYPVLENGELHQAVPGVDDFGLVLMPVGMGFGGMVMLSTHLGQSHQG